jgi:hypothetical protein
MSTKKVELSGAAADIIHALFFRGALQDGDLPSKAGTSELRELGFAETRHTATKFKEGDYFTFLTPSGAEYARQFLVETRFGAEKVASRNYTIGINVDASQARRAINALDEQIRNSEVFKHLSVKFEAGMNTSIHESLINACQLSLKTHTEGVEAIVKNAIELHLKPGGSIWRMINER